MGSPWRCPECETFNTGDKCIICGCSKSIRTENVSSQDTTQSQEHFQDQSTHNRENSNKYVQPSNQEVKKSAFPKFFGIGCAIGAVLCLVMGFLAYWVVHDDPSESIPISISTNHITSNEYEQATVIFYDSITTTEPKETMPPITEEQNDGETVVPEIGEKKDTVVLPSLLGKNYSDAIKILDSLGLTYTITFSDKKYVNIGENCVYLQKPASGAEVSLDTVIKVGVSTYKEESKQTTTTPPRVTEPKITNTTPKIATVDTSIQKETASNTTPPKQLKYYTINFYVKGEVIPVMVEEGKDAETPIVEFNPETEEFIGWNGNYKNVTEDRDVYALFESITKAEITTTTTAAEKLRVGYDGDVVLLLTFNSYSLDDLNVPIEGTSWSDYYWKSSNEYSVQVISGSLQTYFEGDAVLTLTYIYDTSIVATTKVRIVSQIT